MKTLAIDFGYKNIGLAFSDELGIVASKLPGLKVKTRQDAIEGLLIIIEDLGIEKILIGMPSKGKITDSIKDFKKALAKETSLEIVEWNEDFSSKQAEKGKSRKFKKEKSHSEAARILLQEYLESLS